MPIKLFTNGEILDAAEVNDYFMDQAILIFEDETDRDTAFGGPGEPALGSSDEGRIAYLKSDDTLYIWDGSSWTPQLATVTNGSVTTVKLDQTSGSEAVTTATIRDAAVTSAKLASGLTLSGTTTLSSTAAIGQLLEKATRNSTALTSTATNTNVNFLDGAVYWFTGAHAANMRVNFRGDAGTRLTDLLTTDSNSATIVLMLQQTTARQFASSAALVVDGDKASPPTVTTYWFGGAIPSGSTNGIDIYTFTFVKTGSSAVSIFASQAKYAAV